MRRNLTCCTFTSRSVQFCSKFILLFSNMAKKGVSFGDTLAEYDTKVLSSNKAQIIKKKGKNKKTDKVLKTDNYKQSNFAESEVPYLKTEKRNKPEKRKSAESDEVSPAKKLKVGEIKGKKKLKKFVKASSKSDDKINGKKDEFDKTSPTKKLKPCEMKFKERKEMRKQKKRDEKFDVAKNLKQFWEELRREDCEETRKATLLKQVCGIIKGRAKEFVYAHDTVRVIETVFAVGTEEHRSQLFNELKDDIIPLAKAKYGKHFLLKVLRYGSKKQKEEIINAFQGLITKLMKHTEAAVVVETAFNECANALQRFQMIQEFYGSSYRFFKESNVTSLSELLEKKPETKTSVINSLKEELLKVLEKSVVKHSLVHHVLLQFFLNCDPASRSEIIESLKEVVPEILHTKDGSRVAMHCVWYGTAKDRKAIVKSMKTFVKKIAMEEHGHMVLLALFDCVDDTILIDKVIIKELQENLLEISQNVHGKKVLVYLISPRDQHYFCPDIIKILKAGDNNETSKKEPEKRHEELKQAISKPLIQLIVDKIADLYRDNAFCLFTAMVLKFAVGDKKAAYESVSKLLCEPLTSENKNAHIIENSGAYFMLKQLVLFDTVCQKEGKLNSVSFSEVLVSTVPPGVMKTWFHCNRGAFFLVNLLETEIPPVINKVKEELTGCRKHINKYTFPGAEILLKKLREFLV